MIFPATRMSHPIESGSQVDRFGFIKLRLGHSAHGSVLVPEHLFVLGREAPAFFQPSFFGPPYLGFTRPSKHDSARFSMDVAAPREAYACRLLITVKRSGLRKLYPDGAQLYWCTFTSPPQLWKHAAGEAARLCDGDFALRLFHHTDAAGYEGIMASRYFRSSAWNIQGVRQLADVAHTYFTSLDRILDDNDLARIAMSRAGTLNFQTTSARPVEDVLPMSVYRADTADRNNTISIFVPSAILAPPHLFFHPSISGEPAYYEMIGPEIFRIAVRPGAVVPIAQSFARPVLEDRLAFNAAVMGHAGTLDGLRAPYDEEATSELMFHEALRDDLFAFWKSNQNSDLVSGRRREQVAAQ